MQNLAKFLIFALFLTSSDLWAYVPKEGNVTAAVGPYLHQNDFQSAGSRLEVPVLGGFALIAQGDVNDRGSLDLGFFYLQKDFYRDQGSQFLAEKTDMLLVTMGYRWWLSERFSTAFAFFSSYTMGEPEVMYRTVTPGESFDTSATDITEYGLQFSLQAELWTQDQFALILDGRYSYFLTLKENEHGNDYGALIALRYLVQEKKSQNEKTP
ncbi:MAG: hypothetical protein ACAH59_13275 [Pseudobdellovibrionaceae bacterium]